MLIINPLKPIYIDYVKQVIRMGNFKYNGKELEYEDNDFIKIFEIAKVPISIDNLIEKMIHKTNFSKDDIEYLIDSLKKEKFLIDYEKYQKILEDEEINRQNLFFSMVSDNIKNWNLDKQPKILILGLGGIGANVAMILTRAGFEKFVLVDYDIVEKSNLIRQFPYDLNDVGKPKIEILAEKLKKENVSFNLKNKKIEKCEDISKEIENSDFVICTLDKPSRIIRRIINELCIKYKKPVIFSGFSEHIAMVGPFILPQKTACLNCIENKNFEKNIQNVKIAPSYGPLCLLISSIVANETINYFTKFKKYNLIGKTMMINILNYNKSVIKWEKNNNCEVCSNDCK